MHIRDSVCRGLGQAEEVSVSPQEQGHLQTTAEAPLCKGLIPYMLAQGRTVRWRSWDRLQHPPPDPKKDPVVKKRRKYI